MATGKQIKHYREKLKWTLQQLSDACDVDVGTISALEIRDSSRSKFFAPIAKAFGLSVEQLEDESVDHPLLPPSLRKTTSQYPTDRDGNSSGPQIAADTHVIPMPQPKLDKFTAEAVHIFSKLTELQRAECVGYLRGYLEGAGPPSYGQTLPMAVKKEGAA